MPRKQFLAIKDEPEDSFDFHELFPVVNECPFSSLSPIDINPLQFEQHEIKSEKFTEATVPPLWFIEKCKLEEDLQDGMSDSSSNKSFGSVGASRDEILSKFLPNECVMSPAVMERAEELKQQEYIRHERFIEAILEKYPVDKSYHPSKARKYDNSDVDMADEGNQRQNVVRRSKNDKSIESRYKKKVERTVNAYTVIHLRERILAYQTRMSIMKQMLLQNDILCFDDLSSDEYDTASASTSPSLSSSPSAPSFASTDDTTTISSLSDFESDTESMAATYLFES